MTDPGRPGPGTPPGTARVCAVVVTHDRMLLLRNCLAALRAQTRPCDAILVVDNASSDGTAAMLAAETGLEVLRSGANLGGAGGFALGIERGYARGFDWLWLMDDDTEPEARALEELLAAEASLSDGPRPEILASQVVWPDGTISADNMHYQPRDTAAVARAVERGLLPLRCASFVSLLLHRGAVAAHGLPQAAYFLWMDDTEFTARVLRRGFGVWVPRSRACHRTARPMAPESAPPGRFYYAVRNRLWMATASSAWEPKERVRICLDVARLVPRFLLRQGVLPAAWGAVLRGLADGLLRRPPAVAAGASEAETR